MLIKTMKAGEVPPPKSKGGRAPGWPIQTLEAFLASGAEAAKVEPRKNIDNRTGYASLLRARDRHKYPVKVMMRKGEVYLMRKTSPTAGGPPSP